MGRGALARITEDSLPLLTDVIDGEALTKMRVPVRELLRYARCSSCDGQMRELRPDQECEIEVMASPAMAERLRALDMAMRFGVGTDKSYDEVLVGALARATADVFAGDTRLVELNDRWCDEIGRHVRGLSEEKG